MGTKKSREESSTERLKQIQNTACISLRKGKTKANKYTAGDLKSDNYINKLIYFEGFRVL